MKQVLIVDDALFMRNLLREILEQAGWQVVAEAENGQQAVELYAEHRPDLVLMDIVMPELSGIEALKIILEKDPQATVVMCSALGQKSMIMEAVSAGARDFIVKPFQEQQVREVIARICAPS